MIFEAPILRPGQMLNPNEMITAEAIEKLDGKEVNIPLLDEPGATDPKNIIGVCRKLFCREGVLWAEFELFKFDISLGLSLKKPDVEIFETVIVKEPDVPPPRNIDYAKD